MPATLANVVDGQTFRINDGNGSVVTFEINNTALPTPTVTAGNVAVNINLTTATKEQLALAMADAINKQRDAAVLVGGVASVVGDVLTIRGDDDDGVTFGRRVQHQEPNGQRACECCLNRRWRVGCVDRLER